MEKQQLNRNIKTDLIQDLLDKKQITAAEAMLLLQKDYWYYPYVYNWPYVQYSTNPFIGSSTGTLTLSAGCSTLTTGSSNIQLKLFPDGDTGTKSVN